MLPIGKIIFLFIFGFYISASAAEIFEFSRPIRAQGMGGVYLPFVEPVDAVLWNPAVLADNSGLAYEIANLGLGANGLATYNVINTYSKCGSALSCYDPLYGVPIWIGLNGKTSLAVGNFGATLFTFTSLNTALHNPAFPELDTTFNKDDGALVGMGFHVARMTSVGLTLKQIRRWGGTQAIGVSTLTGGALSVSTLQNNFNSKGTGYGFDVGGETKIPGLISTIFSAHWQDVGSTSFVQTAGGPPPDRIHDNLSLGIGTEFVIPGLSFRSGVEYRNVTLQGEQIGKKIHLGAELGLPFVDLRAGLNQGYTTYGVGVDVLFFRIDAATYTEELGVYPGQSPSARLEVGLSFSMSVDADFGFLTGGNGRYKNQKLKQRR